MSSRSERIAVAWTDGRVSYVGVRIIWFGEAWVIEAYSKIVIENISITLNMVL